jgi:hypothetical protein
MIKLSGDRRIFSFSLPTPLLSPNRASIRPSEQNSREHSPTSRAHSGCTWHCVEILPELDPMGAVSRGRGYMFEMTSVFGHTSATPATKRVCIDGTGSIGARSTAAPKKNCQSAGRLASVPRSHTCGSRPILASAPTC